MNFARYLVLWDALEPSPGKIDEAYVERIATDVDRLGAAGIRVMLDMHQDVYATKFCCDGAPAWAIRDDDQPFVLQTTWSFNYLQPAVERAFDNFWDPNGKDADLQEHYADVWKALAKRFAGDANVIGYDLINEPYPGSDFEAIEALSRVSPPGGGMSKTFDETKLGPFYQRMTDAIRTVDSDHWIFFEPRYAAPGNGSPSYLPRITDPRSGEPRLVLAPHLYSSSAEANGAYALGDPTAKLWEEQRTIDMAAQGGPLLLGEWWAFSWAAPNATPFTLDLLAMADRMMIGWAYWSYGKGAPGSSSLVGLDGTDNPSVDIVVRPYPRAIAGEPVSWSYDPNSKIFDLVFNQRAGDFGHDGDLRAGDSHLSEGLGHHRRQRCQGQMRACPSRRRPGSRASRSIVERPSTTFVSRPRTESARRRLGRRALIRLLRHAGLNLSLEVFFDGFEVEARALLHGREVDERLGDLRDLLL